MSNICTCSDPFCNAVHAATVTKAIDSTSLFGKILKDEKQEIARKPIPNTTEALRAILEYHKAYGTLDTDDGEHFLKQGQTALTVPNQQDANPSDSIEALIDSHGLAVILVSIAEICYAKGEHLRANWQDDDAGKRWERAGRAVTRFSTHAAILTI